jgi:hypothetical protein
MDERKPNEITTGIEYFEAAAAASDHSADTACPACGLANAVDEGGAYDICARCGWEDDPVQRDRPESAFGANGGWSLKAARDHLANGYPPEHAFTRSPRE